MVKNLATNAGDIRDRDSTPGWGRFPEGVHGHSLQYSCLENPKDRRAWWAMVPRVTKSQTRQATQHTSMHTELLYNVVFNCCTTKWFSYIYIYIYIYIHILFFIYFFYYALSEDTEYSSLWHRVGSCLPILQTQATSANPQKSGTYCATE